MAMLSLLPFISLSLLITRCCVDLVVCSTFRTTKDQTFANFTFYLLRLSTWFSDEPKLSQNYSHHRNANRKRQKTKASLGSTPLNVVLLFLFFLFFFLKAVCHTTLNPNAQLFTLDGSYNYDDLNFLIKQ